MKWADWMTMHRPKVVQGLGALHGLLKADLYEVLVLRRNDILAMRDGQERLGESSHQLMGEYSALAKGHSELESRQGAFTRSLHQVYRVETREILRSVV